jgi:hypothetical protein
MTAKPKKTPAKAAAMSTLPPPAADKKSKQIKPGAGGARPGAGRPPGAVSEERKALKTLAQAHTESAVKALADLCSDQSQPGMVRIAASCALLDRGHGRPVQSVAVEGTVLQAADPAALIALSEAMDRSREERRAMMERRKQMGFTGD